MREGVENVILSGAKNLCLVWLRPFAYAQSLPRACEGVAILGIAFEFFNTLLKRH